MATAEFDIEVQRNADYSREFSLTDSTGAPLDLTGAVFAMDIKYRAGDPDPPLASFTITPVDLAGGVVLVEIDGAALAAVEGDFEPVRLAYDWLGTQDGDTYPIARGALILMPGVS